MPDEHRPSAPGQGFGTASAERMPLPAPDAMDDAQRAVAKALAEGPRKGVFGPFVPLLRTPELLESVGKVGEYLRFRSALEARIRELVTCVVARHVSNQFEWVMHEPLARKAGVADSTLRDLAVGARPRELPRDEELALDFTRELLASQGVSDLTYAAALKAFGETQVVELTILIGYFAMVSWLMNVARTPPQAAAEVRPLSALPQ